MKNNFIEIAPFSQGNFNYFLLAFISQNHFSRITVNILVGLSSEQETATAKYVGVKKVIREILIEIAPFHGKRINQGPILSSVRFRAQHK